MCLNLINRSVFVCVCWGVVKVGEPYIMGMAKMEISNIFGPNNMLKCRKFSLMGRVSVR